MQINSTSNTQIVKGHEVNGKSTTKPQGSCLPGSKETVYIICLLFLLLISYWIAFLSHLDCLPIQVNLPRPPWELWSSTLSTTLPTDPICHSISTIIPRKILHYQLCTLSFHSHMTESSTKFLFLHTWPEDLVLSTEVLTVLSNMFCKENTYFMFFPYHHFYCSYYPRLSLSYIILKPGMSCYSLTKVFLHGNWSNIL